MKKIIWSGVAILVIVGVLYVAIETPEASPFVAVYGVLAGFSILGLALYIRLGETAERWRNFRSNWARRRQRENPDSNSSGDASPLAI